MSASAGSAADEYIQNRSHESHEHARELAQPAILLVEDDPDIRETLRAALEDEGYEVLEAEDGIEALHMLRESQSPLVVALDLRLPRLRGDALLRQMSKSARLPVRHTYLLMTANRELLSPKTLELLKRMGVPVVAKPFDLNDLLNIVAQAADGLSAPQRQ